MSDVKVYDADQVSVSFMGVPLGGYADGEFLTITRDAPTFTDVVGTDGEVTRSKSNDNRATAVVKLMQTSASNAVLAGFHKLDASLPNGAGIGVFMVRDRQGLTVHYAEKAWIQKPPDPSFDREAKERAWEIRLADLVSFEGGN